MIAGKKLLNVSVRPVVEAAVIVDLPELGGSRLIRDAGS